MVPLVLSYIMTVLCIGLGEVIGLIHLIILYQALASCEYFQPFLQRVLEESEVLAVEDSADCVPLTISLAALLEG